MFENGENKVRKVWNKSDFFWCVCIMLYAFKRLGMKIQNICNVVLTRVPLVLLSFERCFQLANLFNIADKEDFTQEYSDEA